MSANLWSRTSNLILHIGANGLANMDPPTAFDRYVALLDRIRHDRPDIPMAFATLVLPRAPKQRLHQNNWRAVRRFNFEAREFNLRLLSLCHEKEGIFYVNHRIKALPPWTVLAANDLHPSFAGVSPLAWNIDNLLLDLRRSYITNWLEHALAQPEAGRMSLGIRHPTPKHCGVTFRMPPVKAIKGRKRTKQPQKQLLPSSTGQHTPSGPPSPSAQPPSRLPRLLTTAYETHPGNGDEG
ncbi:hypothetical protein HPB51_007299 [Rhipicephalus microplus]|uniref:Uncharacterized protein n=1 Tax=Rhipicephalus microplus TaxID=6941 RepID=A0A9J6EFG8_RHIMP|nr:hypothetical protein HPB51_007299 [Rhipicephalus microplus]